MTLPTMTEVTSSNLHSVGHDGEALYVKFRSGAVYRYPTAGKEHHDALLTAVSPGGFFMKSIRSAHKGERVDVGA